MGVEEREESVGRVGLAVDEGVGLGDGEERECVAVGVESVPEAGQFFFAGEEGESEGEVGFLSCDLVVGG